MNGESSTHIKSKLGKTDLVVSSDADSRLRMMRSFAVDSDAVLGSLLENYNLHHWNHDLDLQELCHRLRCSPCTQNLYLSLMAFGNAFLVDVSSMGSDLMHSPRLNRTRMPLLNRTYQGLRRPQQPPLQRKFQLWRNLSLDTKNDKNKLVFAIFAVRERFFLGLV